MLVIVLVGVWLFLLGILSLGFAVTSASDLLAVIALIVSMLTFFVTTFWNYWVFRQTSDVYQPVLDFEFGNIKNFASGISNKVNVTIHNKGDRNFIPEKVVATGTWFDEEILCDVQADLIPPRGSIRISVSLPSAPEGTNMLTITAEDESAPVYWYEEAEIIVPSSTSP